MTPGLMCGIEYHDILHEVSGGGPSSPSCFCFRLHYATKQELRLKNLIFPEGEVHDCAIATDADHSIGPLVSLRTESADVHFDGIAARKVRHCQPALHPG